MKIMKVLGVVVGIHVFALILIFANPGCSSTSKPSPAPIDTVAQNAPAPTVTATGISPSVNVPMSGSPVSAAPINFNPDAPALAAGGNGIRFAPTRPNTSAAATLVAEPVTDVTPASTYAVKSGDSLWTIAKNNKLTVAELAAANNLKTTATLHQGQKLIIPAKKATSVAATPATTAATATVKTTASPAPKASADSVKHTVKSGESLSTIAKKYGVKQGDIAVANNVTDPQKIYAGMELVIPGWQTPGGKSGATKQTPTKSGAPAPAKAPVPEIKPLFTAPVISPGADGDAKPAAPGEVPVIKVDETPADAKPKS